LKSDFPKIITSLPEADIDSEGVRGWIAQGDNHQMVFFEINPSAVVPEHSHNAQWGIVVEEEMELVIDGKARFYRKGDEYFIPTRTRHSAKFLTKCRIIDFFTDKTRFKPKLTC
jgi:quercetin dioxygenase-like cupin family protein